MRRWTNDSGAAGSYSSVFDAFGQVVSQSGSRPPYGFGADWAYRDDGDAGLLHIGARWYDPVIGRWITADKYLGDFFDPLSLNRYVYCKDDPLQWVDPSGLQHYPPRWVWRLDNPSAPWGTEPGDLSWMPGDYQKPPVAIPPAGPRLPGIIGLAIAAAVVGWIIGSYIADKVIPPSWYEKAGNWLYNLWPAPWHIGL